MMLRSVGLTTVHQRKDTRIFLKEMHCLAASFPGQVGLIVADGIGDEIAGGGIGIFDVGQPAPNRLSRAAMGSLRALRLIRQQRPERIHFHDPELIPLGLLLKALGHQVIYDVHEDLPRQVLGKEWIPALLRVPTSVATRVLEFIASRCFDAIVAATPSIAARFSGRRTVLLQNFPIQSELVASDPVPYASRPNHFVYVGGVSTIRGAAEMVRASGRVAPNLGARVHIAGRFEPPGLRERLMALDGWSTVVEHGHLLRPELARLMGSVRAGLVLFHPVPNHVESQPTKLFEYMAAGLPVIASDFPLWREIVGGAGCGILVDPIDEEAIADAMGWIIDHATEAEAMGRRGRSAVERIYNWEREATKLIDLYRALDAATESDEAA